MSIIHDALKKVQHSFGQAASDKKKAEPSLGEPSKKDPQSQPATNTVPTPFYLPEEKQIRQTSPNPQTVLPKQAPLFPKKIPVVEIVLGSSVCLGLLVAIVLLSRVFTQSHEKPANPFQDITIKGVLTQDDKNLVLINDGIYEIGETVAGIRIVGISINSVQVLKDGKTHSLKIEPNKTLNIPKE